MQVPLSWLKDFVTITLTPQELAEMLVRRGIGVENLELPARTVSGVRVGKIIALDKHPNADKLQIASVDLGRETKSIITAATNVKTGDVIPVALDGAELATGMSIKPTKLRGVLSDGMMCSANELGLDLKELPQEQKEGIMLLPPDSPLGGDVAELMLLNDAVLHFEIFANRPDLLSVTGIAREVAAALGQKLKLPEVQVPETGSPTAGLLSLQVEDLQLCPYYRARLFSDIYPAPSPLTLAGRLRKSGIRCVDNMVDLTNYVMLETGQPLHAFDYDRLEGHAIIVRLARKGESIITLDESEILLEPYDLVIADASKPVAVAGIMGGKHSEVNSATTRILLECATFNPVNIRRTAQRLGLRSESSRRFEKGLDPYMVRQASERAAQYFSGYGATVHAGAVEVSAPLPQPRRIQLRGGKLNALLGTAIPASEMRAFLEAEEIKILAVTPEVMEFEVPSYRADLEQEIDLVEEVARAYGYDRIEATMPEGGAIGRKSRQEQEDDWLRTVLTRLGCCEIVTFALHDEEVNRSFKLPAPDIKVLNPLSQEQGSLRVSLLPGMSKVVAAGAAHAQRVCAFELANLYGINEFEELEERRVLALGACGGNYDFFAFKGLIENLLEQLGITYKFEPASLPYLQEGLSARILHAYAGGSHEVVGHCGALAPGVQESLDAPHKLWYAELQLATKLYKDNLQQKSLQQRLSPQPRFYEPLPKFPASERDLAFVLPEQYPCGSLTEVISELGSPLLQKVACFDIYKGKPIPEGFQNQAFRLTFMASDRTLTEEELNQKIDVIIKAVTEKFGAQLRM